MASMASLKYLCLKSNVNLQALVQKDIGTCSVHVYIVQKLKRPTNIFFTPLSFRFSSLGQQAKLLMPASPNDVFLAVSRHPTYYIQGADLSFLVSGHVAGFLQILTWHVSRLTISNFEFIDTFLKESLYTFEII
jgi:hypothetical protein